MRRRLAADRRAFNERARWAQNGVTIAQSVLLTRDPGTTLEIGAGTTIADHCLLHLQRDPNAQSALPCTLRIGRRTAINEFCNLRASGGEIHIGDNCLIAQFVSIIASSHGTTPGLPMRDQPWKTSQGRVVIGDDVWLGANVIVLPGVAIGRGSIIGAGSVVTHDVLEGMIAAGVPARVLRARS
jgi:acetyltransferase-like isoleucine patch superfamily enzyme